jgi:hypothetical protein
MNRIIMVFLLYMAGLTVFLCEGFVLNTLQETGSLCNVRFMAARAAADFI